MLALERQPVEIQPSASDDEIVAVIIAVQTLLSTEASAPPQEQEIESGWHHAAKLSIQSLRPVKLVTPPRWNTIERLRRSSGGFYGITGL